jgi:BNR/Asp-box repeat
MARLRLALPAILLVLSACGGGEEEPAEPASAPAGTTPDIVSIAIDPADGTLFAGSGPAFYRLPPGAKEPETAKGALSTPKGSGTLTKDVIVRFEKPGTIIASGHSGEAALPPVLGILRSTDKGETWEPISGLGEADYHEIEVVGDRIFALRNEDPGMIQISDDGGKTWDTREAPSVAAPIDVAVNPGDPKIWAVSTDQGIFVSQNEGRSWRQRDTTFGARIAWGAPDALYAAGKDGKVSKSADGGGSWQEVGSIGAGPKELIVSPKGELYASVSGPEIRRSTDGGATWSKVIALGA